MLGILSENVYTLGINKHAGASAGPQPTSKGNKLNVVPGIPNGKK